jgi:GMP synthase (glutamine-hydrolysing)
LNHELILVLDFGGQYNQLIARRVREANVYCEVLPYNTSIEIIKSKNPKGIIFTGGPASVLDEKAPKCDPEVFNLGVPVLGICYGMQLMSVMLGGNVAKASNREYGKIDIELDSNGLLFQGLDPQTSCWMSHTYHVDKLPEGFKAVAKSTNCGIAAMENTEKRFYAVQFHPEVNHTPKGRDILNSFLFKACGLSGDWQMSSFVEESVRAIREKVGDKKVLCALSGGVDSSVAAALIHKAVGNQLTCIFVDHGLLRKDEGDQVEQVFKSRFQMNLIRVNAEKRFLDRLAGITDTEQKRKIIGEEFIRVFEEEPRRSVTWISGSGHHIS